MSIIDNFLDSDVQTISSRDRYLAYAKNVLTGQQAELELTGNSFNVRFLPSNVYIENLWDEDDEPIEIDLKKFINIISNWNPQHQNKKDRHCETKKQVSHPKKLF